MAQRRGRIVLLVVLALLGLSAWRTASLQQDKHKLTATYDEARRTIAELQGEQGRLSNELGQAKRTVVDQAADIEGLEQELTLARGQLDKTLAELGDLQQTHVTLQERATSMEARLASVEEEKRQLEARLSSIKELQLAIRDVRRKLWNERWAKWKARIQTARDSDRTVLASDNQGYVIHQGVSTLGTRTRLHVRVLDVQSE